MSKKCYFLCPECGKAAYYKLDLECFEDNDRSGVYSKVEDQKCDQSIEISATCTTCGSKMEKIDDFYLFIREMTRNYDIDILAYNPGEVNIVSFGDGKSYIQAVDPVLQISKSSPNILTLTNAIISTAHSSIVRVYSDRESYIITSQCSISGKDFKYARKEFRDYIYSFLTKFISEMQMLPNETQNNSNKVNNTKIDKLVSDSNIAIDVNKPTSIRVVVRKKKV